MMSSAAILSIKPVYADQILDGTKTIELRKSSMGLNAGDVILVYSSAPAQHLGFWIRVRNVETLPVGQMWQKYGEWLGIGYADYIAYFGDARMAVGLHVGEIHRIVPISLKEIQELVPGFVPPQGLIWLREELGKYERLLHQLSDPLPQDVFSQQRLDLDLSPRAAE